MNKEREIDVKVSLLSKGVSYTENFIKNFGDRYLDKHRVYGNPDPLDVMQIKIPQELYILPQQLICSIKINHSSPWKLDYDGEFFITHPSSKNRIKITFPLKPLFYDFTVEQNKAISQFMTLYGGSALGIFVSRNCFFASNKKACQFCSITPNLKRNPYFASVIKRDVFKEALVKVLKDETSYINQIMINGGNFRNFDENFLYYIDLAKIAEEEVKKSGKNIDVHLIVFPPEDFSLFNKLKNTNFSIAMNTEAYDKNIFKRVCSGKEYFYGQDKIFDALKTAAEVLPKNKVYSIFVGGLEPIDSLKEGLYHHASNGIVPVINVLHIDPETPLENEECPSEDLIYQMGAALQNVYRKFNLKPFYEYCGRNSLDHEAFLNLF